MITILYICKKLSKNKEKTLRDQEAGGLKDRTPFPTGLRANRASLKSRHYVKDLERAMSLIAERFTSELSCPWFTTPLSPLMNYISTVRGDPLKTFKRLAMDTPELLFQWVIVT